MSVAGDATQVPLREGLFTIPSRRGALPRLHGSECPQCRARFAGPRAICLKCGQRGLSPCLLSPTGTVWTFTIVRQTPRGSVMEAPYAIGQVKLDDGPVITTALVGVPLESVRVGLPVEMTLHPLRTNDDGRQVVAYAFRPHGEKAGT